MFWSTELLPIITHAFYVELENGRNENIFLRVPNNRVRRNPLADFAIYPFDTHARHVTDKLNAPTRQQCDLAVDLLRC